jgi:hypothetical protein
MMGIEGTGGQAERQQGRRAGGAPEAAIAIRAGGVRDGVGARGRGRRADAGKARPTERDVDVLRVIGEQFAVSMPQAQLLLGVGTERAARWSRDRWRKAGWVDSRVLLHNGPSIIWLTRAGQRVAGIDYKVWSPSVGNLEQILAINHVRIQVRRHVSDAAWICARELRRYDRPTVSEPPHRPDGVVDFGDDGGQVAVQIELFTRKRRYLLDNTEKLLDRYPGGVWYFARRPQQPTLMRVARDLGERVNVYDLPAAFDRWTATLP